MILDFQLNTDDRRPFGRSLHLLLEAGILEHRAHAACLYEHLEQDSRLLLRHRVGHAERRIQNARITLPVDSSNWLLQLHEPATILNAPLDSRVGTFPEVILHGLAAVTVVPLVGGSRLLGLITVGWKRDTVPSDTDGMRKLGRAASAIIARESQTTAAIQLAQRVAALEAELADLKISERTEGILANSDHASARAALISDHIDKVLQASNPAGMLRRQVEALQVKLHDRRLLANAKTLLQQKCNMTEEEAYLYLRNTSRRQRKPLRVIAGELFASGSQLEGPVPHA